MTLLRAVFISLLTPSLASAQALRGTVLDETTGSPVPQARVTVLGAAGDSVRASATSNAQGIFVVDLPAEGIYRVRVESIGYTTHTTAQIAVPRGNLVTIELRVRTSAIPLEPLRVIAQRDEPYFMRDVRRRERHGFGYYLDRATLDDRAGSDLRGLVSSTPGLRMARFFEAPVIETRGLAVAGRHCFATIYINGAKQFSVDQISDTVGVGRYLAEAARERMNDLFIIRPGDLEAIEVYRNAAEVPAEFSGSDAECGVVALWLRSGFEAVGDNNYDPGAPLRFQIAAAGTAFSGSTAADPGGAVEGSVHFAIGRMSIGVIGTRGRHTLPSSTTNYYAGDLDPRSVVVPPGPRPMTIDGVGAEITVVFRTTERIQPVISPRMMLLRRTFTLQDAHVENRTTSLTSDGTSIGVTVGARMRVTNRGTVHGGAVLQRLSFDPFELLERSDKPTSSEWNAVSLRLGYEYAIGR